MIVLRLNLEKKVRDTFKSVSSLHGQNMSELIRRFIAAYCANPKKVERFIKNIKA